MRLMSRGNNVQRLDLVVRMCALYKNRVLLLLLYLKVFVFRSQRKLAMLRWKNNIFWKLRKKIKHLGNEQILNGLIDFV